MFAFEYERLSSAEKRALQLKNAEDFRLYGHIPHPIEIGKPHPAAAAMFAAVAAAQARSAASMRVVGAQGTTDDVYENPPNPWESIQPTPPELQQSPWTPKTRVQAEPRGSADVYANPPNPWGEIKTTAATTGDVYRNPPNAWASIEKKGNQ